MAKSAPAKRPRIFPGWWTVLGGGLIAWFGYGVHHYAFGAFLKPIASDLGVGRALVAGAGSMSRLEGGIEALIGGWVVDRYGPRLVCMTGMFVGGLGFAAMYFVESVVGFYAAWFISSLGFNLGVTIPLDAAIANWFVKKRGFALAVMRALVGLSGITIVPLLTLLIQSYGWRPAFLIAAVSTWVFTLPITWLFVKPKRPGHYGLLPDGADPDSIEGHTGVAAGVKYAEAAQEYEFTLRQALKTRSFWLLLLGDIFHGMVGPAVAVHQIAYLTDRGVNPVAAAGAIGLMLLLSIPGRLLGGILADRVRKTWLPTVQASGYLLQTVGLTIFLWAESLSLVYVYLCLYGIGFGICVGVDAPLRARYFGRKAFASIGGVMRFISMPVVILAPIYAGWVYDATGSYRDAFVMITALMVVAIVAVLLVRPPKPPPQRTDHAQIV